jgi:hypothetical protein
VNHRHPAGHLSEHRLRHQGDIGAQFRLREEVELAYADGRCEALIAIS